MKWTILPRRRKAEASVLLAQEISNILYQRYVLHREVLLLWFSGDEKCTFFRLDSQKLRVINVAYSMKSELIKCH
jgi:hypothetical protein